MKLNISEEELLAHRKHICDKLKERREALGWSQDELAEKVGTTRSTVSKIETGEWNFGFAFITAFCKFLDMELVLKEKE